jgi:phosphodiesterase/alkaline phosphatase D-like protein
VTPPVVSGIAASPGLDGMTAQITWTTDEASDSRVDFGTSPGSLTLSASEPALVLSHAVGLSALTPSTTYYYRVTSADGSSNSATEPVPPGAPLTFATPAPECLTDDTAAQFGAGTATNTAVTEVANGEVILKPAAGADFLGLPPTSEWQSFPWSAGGASTVSAGTLTVDGARFNTEPAATTYGPGTTLEFVATFNAGTFEHIGFGAGGDNAPGEIYNTFPMAAFSTGNTAAAVITRIWPSGGGGFIDYTIPLSLIGSAHRYRIDWKPAGLDFYVDGSLVRSEASAIVDPMRPAASDLSVGGPALVVDWIRALPFAASGTYLSRVYDSGGSATWGGMTWMAGLPSGTSLQMAVRTGNSPTPDAAWTAFTPVASSGTVVGGSSRYIQYRANLATTDGAVTPEVDEVHIACVAGADVTPPVISGVTATPVAGGSSAAIAWNTDELATSRVDYGTSPASLTLTTSNASPVSVHGLTLTGLTPETAYYYRVTSTDAANNTATEPNPPAAPLGFVTLQPPCAVDGTVADFTAGTTGSATYVSQTLDGEVILQPTEGAEFSGTSLPAGWTLATYSGGGTAVVGGGHVSVDGAYVATGALYGAGRSVEFVATFDGTAAGQHAGFGTDLNAAPWALFSTHGGGVLEARTNPGSETNEVIPGSWLGAPHRFRIDWKTDSLIYWIDGARVAAHAVTISASMRPIAADGPVGGAPFQADWMRMTPYPASGSYTSRVFDAGGPATWGVATWTGDVPAGTTLSLFARRGSTPSPDGTWTTYAAIPSSGSSISGGGRYLQYRADLATTDPGNTPALRDVTIQCSSTPDVTAPLISSVVATPAVDGITATVTWITDEPSTSRVDFGASPGSLTLSASDGAYPTSHSLTLSGLAPLTTYYYRVTSVDPSLNSATDPNAPAAPRSFTTPAAPCPSDQTAADFGLGTLDANTAISLEGDGEVILAPQLMTEFPGAALPAGWSSGTWAAGGTATVGGGALTVDGAHVNTDASFGPGRSLEFVATYQAATFQNIGLAVDGVFNSPWVTIGMGGNTSGVFARTSGGTETLLSTTTLGSPHRYRIDWNASTFVFYVDGAQVATLNFTVSGNMVALVSDFNVGGNVVSVDWLRVTPYAASGSFASRVFDGQGPTNWGAATWSSSTPAGTGLSIFARTGNTPVPDGSWSAYDPLTNGVTVGMNSRYVQYRADLTATTPPYATPVLQGLAIACTAGPDLTPPVISNIAVVPAPDGLSATLTWTTDERSTSRVDYGVNPAALGANQSNPALVRAHSLALTGLSPGSTYYYRVTSVDGSSNGATSPNPPAAPLSFQAPMPACFVDQTESQFGQGTPTSTYVSATADGEVVLAPAYGSEFSGSSLSSDWTSALWSGAGAGGATVSGGNVAEDGGRLTPVSTTGYGAGNVIEFAATFGAAPFQNAGFGAGDNSLGGSGMFATGAEPWAMFGTANTTTTLFSRLNPGGDVSLGTSYLGSPHLYRIEWRADSVVFIIDGASVSRRAAVLSTAMRPGISDFNAGAPALSVDWLRMTPYAASGTFLSRVYDAGASTLWGNLSWTATTPTGTTLAMAYRTGDTAVPDGGWSTFTTVGSSGGAVGAHSRYIQYRAQLGATDVTVTPALQDVSVTCCTDVTPPVAMSDVAAQRLAVDSNADGTLQIRVTFTAPADAAAVEVYRAGFGKYPEYDDPPGAGSVPAAPSYPPNPARWSLTGITASGQTDEVAQRDQYYYAAFAKDPCGNVSVSSNVTPGVLNYVLGDASNGLAACTGDDLVNLADVSFLGANYGISLATSDPLGCLDVGPTTDGSVTARPTTDNVLDFEDLIVIAINYMLGSRPPSLASRATATTRDGLTLDAPSAVRAGDAVTARLLFEGTGAVHGVSTQLSWDAAVVEPVGSQAGAMLHEQGGVAFSSKPGNVDAAVLGAGATGLVGAGELATVTFRALASGDPGIRIASVRARDAANHPVALGEPAAGVERPAAPLRTELGPVYPNPFSAGLGVQLSLARAGHVKLVVYDMAGRRVRRLLDGGQPAGVQLVRWDGRDEGGRLLPAGFYVLRLEAGSIVRTRRLELIR